MDVVLIGSSVAFPSPCVMKWSEGIRVQVIFPTSHIAHAILHVTPCTRRVSNMPFAKEPATNYTPFIAERKLYDVTTLTLT